MLLSSTDGKQVFKTVCVRRFKYYSGGLSNRYKTHLESVLKQQAGWKCVTRSMGRQRETNYLRLPRCSSSASSDH